jgi:hypothetical protein
VSVLTDDRPNVLTNAGAGLTISLKDALRAFREWSKGSSSVQVFFLGKAAASDAVRVSMNGLVTFVDPGGLVTVSGGGREVKLDLNVCECSIARNSTEHRDAPQAFDSNPALHLAFPNGSICLVVPGGPDSSPQPSTGPSGPFRRLRNKMARPAVQSSPVKETAAEPPARGPVKRKIFVDVHHGQPSIVESLDTGNGRTRFRRLKEQFLSRADRAYADRLKRKIAYGENGGTYELDGLHAPKTVVSLGELLQLIEGLERRDGPEAWDRRRYPR